MFQRSFSTQLKTPGLSFYLKRLYRKIHPDVLHQYPRERAVNEESFKRLQSALEEVRHSTAVQPLFNAKDLAQPPSPLHFYYECDNAASQPSTPQIKKSTVVLRKDNIGITLSDLFHSLSLGPFPVHLTRGTGLQDAAIRHGRMDGGNSDVASLRSLFDRARFLVHRSSKSSRRGTGIDSHSGCIQDDMRLAVLALQRSRGVIIDIGNGLPRKGGAAVAVNRLSVALQRCLHVNFEGLRIYIDGGFEASLHSPSFTVTLGICASDNVWDRVLQSKAVLMTASERRQLAHDEQLAAKIIGIDHILYHGVCEGRDSAMEYDYKAYRGILDDLLTAKRKIKAGNTSGLSVIIFGDSSGTTANAEVEQNDEEGILRVGVSIGCAGLMQLIESIGPEIAAGHRRHRAKREASEFSVRYVCRALRLDGLRKDEGISEMEWQHGLNGLLEDAERLRGVSERSHVVIGRVACVLDSGEVQIPWNYRDIVPF